MPPATATRHTSRPLSGSGLAAGRGLSVEAVVAAGAAVERVGAVAAVEVVLAVAPAERVVTDERLERVVAVAAAQRVVAAPAVHLVLAVAAGQSVVAEVAGVDRFNNNQWHQDKQSNVYRKQTRQGGANALNIWIVDFKYLGIATFP